MDIDEVVMLSRVRWSLNSLSELILEKPDSPVLLLLETSPCLGSVLFFLALGLVLLHCNLLWTFLHILFRSIIG
jgi:hypothetical protein